MTNIPPSFTVFFFCHDLVTTQEKTDRHQFRRFSLRENQQILALGWIFFLFFWGMTRPAAKSARTHWLTAFALRAGAGCVLLWRLKMFCSVCLPHFLPALCSSAKQTSLSHPGCRNGTRSHPAATLYIKPSPRRLLCNAALRRRFAAFVVLFYGAGDE